MKTTCKDCFNLVHDNTLPSYLGYCGAEGCPECAMVDTRILSECRYYMKVESQNIQIITAVAHDHEPVEYD